MPAMIQKAYKIITNEYVRSYTTREPQTNLQCLWVLIYLFCARIRGETDTPAKFLSHNGETKVQRGYNHEIKASRYSPRSYNHQGEGVGVKGIIDTALVIEQQRRWLGRSLSRHMTTAGCRPCLIRTVHMGSTYLQGLSLVTGSAQHWEERQGCPQKSQPPITSCHLSSNPVVFNTGYLAMPGDISFFLF